VADFADVIQIGARNMQNYSLLRTVGRCGFTARLRRVDGRLGLTVALSRLASAVQSTGAATLV